MTRHHTKRPVWSWRCDSCGYESTDVSLEQSDLPGFEVMRSRGWFIAKKFGDLCPSCNAGSAVRDDG